MSDQDWWKARPERGDSQPEKDGAKDGNRLGMDGANDINQQNVLWKKALGREKRIFYFVRPIIRGSFVCRVRTTHHFTMVDSFY